MGSFPSLNALLKAVVAGDERAKQTLYEEFKPPLHSFTKRYLQLKGCANPDEDSIEVEDSAWSKIFHNIGKLRNHDSFVRWIKQIIRNEANNHLQVCIEKQEDVSFEDVQNEPFAQIVSAEEVIASAERVEEILILAKTIHPKLPEILRLRFIEELSLCEIAALVDESYGNVRTLYSRGLKKLRAMLRDQEGEI